MGPSFTFDIDGEYTVTLAVADVAGNQASDTITVSVSDTTPPVADAGPDIAVDQGIEVELDGTGSTDNVGISTWTWTFTYDGEPRTLDGAEATYIFSKPAIVEVTLTVSDVVGNEASTSITVTVRDAEPPVANAGEDIVLEKGGTAGFDGRASTDNVDVTEWTWSFRYDAEDREVQGALGEFTFDLPGKYVVTLKVRDASGLEAEDDLLVTVKDKDDGNGGGGTSSTPLILVAVVLVVVIVALSAWFVMRKNRM